MHLRCWKYMLFHVLLELYITQPFSSSVDSLRGPQCQRQHGLIFSHGSHDFDPARPWRLEQLLPQIHGGTECVWTVIRELFPLEQRCTDFYRCVFMYCSVASVVFGSWYDHVNNWWKKKQTYSKLHYMFYEDMIEVFHFFFFVGLLQFGLLFTASPQAGCKTIWWYLITVLTGHWTGTGQTLFLSWFVSFSRGQETNPVWSTVWQHEEERHDQLFNIPCYGFQYFYFHEKR